MTHDPNPDDDVFSIAIDPGGGRIDTARATALAIILDSSAEAIRSLLEEAGYKIDELVLLVHTGDEIGGGVGIPKDRPDLLANLCLRHAEALVRTYNLDLEDGDTPDAA